MQKVIACCYEMCDQPAICSVSTKTGRANVCRTHYTTIERWSAPTNTPFANECREAYKNSYAYRQKHGIAAPDKSEQRKQIEAELEQVRQKMAESLARQPGQDDEELALGIARDPLETEFQNGAPA